MIWSIPSHPIPFDDMHLLQIHNDFIIAALFTNNALGSLVNDGSLQGASFLAGSLWNVEKWLDNL